MPEGILRLEATRELPSDKLVNHVLGIVRPDTAYTRKWLGVGVQVLGAPLGVDLVEDEAARAAFLEDLHAAGRLAVERDAAKKGGKLASLGMSWLFTGGPETNELHRDSSTIPDDAPATLAAGRPWTLADCEDYARTCIGLLTEACPGMHYIAAWHVDEKRVHVQAESVAMVDDTDRGFRIGNAGVREGLARLAPEFEDRNAKARATLVAKEAKAQARDQAARDAKRKPRRRRRFVDKGSDHVYLDEKMQMRLVHDAYAARVERFGIVRGEGGPGKHYRRIDRDKGMQSKFDAMERDAREARELEEQAAKVAAARAAAARADADLAELDANRRIAKAEERAGSEESRAAAAHADRVEHEREAERLRGENEELGEKNREGAATYAQRVADIEAGRAGSAAGRELREDRDEARSELGHERERGQAWNEERMRLKAALGVREDELGRVVDVGGAHALARGMMEKGRDLVWDLLRRFAAESADGARLVRGFQLWIRKDSKERGSGRGG